MSDREEEEHAPFASEDSEDSEYVEGEDEEAMYEAMGDEESEEGDSENEEEHEDDEPEDEDDDEQYDEFWVPSSSEDLHQVLPEDIRATVERVFAGQSLMPMRFVRTEQERKQKQNLPNERIAHQLRGYATDEGRAPLAAQRMSRNSKGKQVYYSLCLREQSGWNSKAQMVKLQETFMPFSKNKFCKVVDAIGERLYCGGFNSTGSRFLVAGQIAQILVYDTGNWEIDALPPARQVQWTVTDAKFTPDDESILYSSITSNVRMVSVDYKKTGREEVFSLLPAMERGGYRSRFGVWCLDVNASGTEFVAGTSSNSVVLYDMETRTPVCHAQGHEDDVNAIAFVDGPLHSNVFVSGSDDSLIKLWDRRVLSESNPKPQGVFPGHIDGITYISSRDDGYYFISNSKDQTCKLWDLRKCYSESEHARLPYYSRPYRWDYRFQEFPGLRKPPVAHPHDKSVMTYRGHLVMETLIRCHFSPLHTTGQKYIYTGSADGRVYVFDTVTGDLVEIFAMKPDGLTRDVRWHPYEPTIVSPDFYGKLCVWQRQP
ncbi:hypothetical protein Poli38472_003093 [Pythium oligandrum]|uniref:Uncharacterized protein n=1 Tax=Pythium oligandrum TaxID=41045 RepID=A0A8K1C669_PYTOL|nr:hypothetical protein Poli38472_003093 [Pythium oligandrum]|eukprot:TMW57168.1 hypothetical protein Poli38472_003093 [Pythium oligandrum]